MIVSGLIFLSAVVASIRCDVPSRSHDCNKTYTTLDNKPLDTKKECEANQKCIVKCCPEGEIFVFNEVPKCKKWIETEYSMFHIYKNNIEQEVALSNKTIEDFKFVYSKVFHMNNTRLCFRQLLPFKDSHYILEDGSLRIRTPHFYNQWKIKKLNMEYCIDKIYIPQKKQFKPAYMSLLEQETDNTSVIEMTVYKPYMMLVSCFFLLLVFIVYCLLPALRNIGGMVLMAYTISLMTGYLLQAIHDLYRMTAEMNMVYAPILYFALLSIFFWMNIMSFDIWWTFRGTRKRREIHRRGEMVKFAWYSLYAWGVPALMAIGAVFVDRADLTNYPSIVKPHFKMCFYYVPESILYLHIPMFTLIAASFILYLMTAYNIWRIDRAFLAIDARRGSTMSTNNKKRLRVYICLSVLMGGSWFLELLNMAIEYDSMIIYILLTIVNLSKGVIIFFILVFKKSILIMLLKRFKVNSDIISRLESKGKQTESSKFSKTTGYVKSTNEATNTHL